MNAVKRTSSTSPPHQRPAKTSCRTCDNCGIAPQVQCGIQHQVSLPCQEPDLACSHASRPATHCTAHSGREAPRSTTVADASFDPFLPRPSSRVNPRSSSGVSSHHRVHRSCCGPQATGFSATEQIRPSRATASTKHTKSPAHSLPDFAQYVTGAGPSSFRSEIVSDARARGNNDSAFDVMAEKKSSSGSVADVDGQGHSTSGQELPSGFEWDLSGDSDFDALCVALTPSAFLTCMPKDLSDAALQQDTLALAQDTDGFSARTGDNTSNRMDSCSDNTRTCMISALNILQALHIPPSACLCACDEPSTPSPRQPRMLDSVLSTNRDVVRLVSNMLKCPCSLSSQVQLVLTIICGKLMAWYRAMIRDDHGGCDDNNNNNNNHLSPIVRSSVVNNNNIMNDKDHTERVLQQPITVGDYSFDGALESKIRAQVVSSELQHLEALVENLSRRIQDAKFGNLYTAAATRSGSAATAENETGLTEAIHRSLIAFLRKQLQAAKAATTPMPSPGEENGRAGLRAMF